jgi:hypothetical protein
MFIAGCSRYELKLTFCLSTIFVTKPFTDYTAEDFKSLVSTNLEGFLYVFGEINRDL